MLKYIVRRTLYGLLVMIGVVILVFFLFQGIGDPSRLVMGQSGDSATQAEFGRSFTWISQNGNNSFFISTMYRLCVFMAKKRSRKRILRVFL
jgi:ABC-type dipeptide/oligopeptide/nickel transport systems, permease components